MQVVGDGLEDQGRELAVERSRPIAGGSDAVTAITPQEREMPAH